MKIPTCPNCRHKLPHLRPKFVADKAIRHLLRLARKPTTMVMLAEYYSIWTGASYLSSRRAIERLTAGGQLKRVSQGIYQTKV